jgi:hypothetical protein
MPKTSSTFPLRTALAAAMTVAVLGLLPGLVPHALAADATPRPVTPRGELAARLDDFRVGDTVRITVTRQGKIRAVRVTRQPGG